MFKASNYPANFTTNNKIFSSTNLANDLSFIFNLVLLAEHQLNSNLSKCLNQLMNYNTFYFVFGNMMKIKRVRKQWILFFKTSRVNALVAHNHLHSLNREYSLFMVKSFSINILHNIFCRSSSMYSIKILEFRQ